MSTVIVYTLGNCPTCDSARAALAERGVEFEERRVDENEEWWEEALKYAFTVPIIISDEGDVEIGWEGEHG
ncbi:MAG: glutaredoxin family protein [Dehalococcoidia bacterium]|nr:MAG: glutaredoxin family protein [Dehalococcoidia bacterium]